jgi:UDP:flavonoid glycosyltransferase YjiC (YdhE family)
MARILAYTSPGRSHLFPLTPILDELHRRGHEIVLRTLASQVELMRLCGFDATPIDARIEAIEHHDWRARNPLQSVRMNAEVFCARAEYDAPDLTEAIAETEPDALLVDINSYGALMAAEAWGGPWAVFCPYPLALRSTDAPPFGPGFAPARGPLGRVRDRLTRPLVAGMLAREVRPPINGIRRSMGLEPVATVEQWFARPPLLLYMTAEPFEYPRRDWPENVVMIGPCDWDPPFQDPPSQNLSSQNLSSQDPSSQNPSSQYPPSPPSSSFPSSRPSSSANPPPWLEQATGPIVLVNTSTEFQNDGRLVQVALEALAEEPVTVVATLPAGDPADLEEIPTNAHVERFIPHTPILERAACAITHGGMGSTQKALAHGVPVCVVPFGRDQLEVARRVEVAHAGTRLPAKRLRPDRLRMKVKEAMTCTAGARRIAAAYAATGGSRTAADAIQTRLL